MLESGDLMVYVDAENISKNLFKRFYAKYPDETYRVYGKPNQISNIYFTCKYVSFINCFSSKNSADTFMVADIVKSIYEDNINNYFIITHDQDLAIAIKILTAHKKNVTLVSAVNGEMHNLQVLGIDFDYLNFEQFSDILPDDALVQIMPTEDTKHIYQIYPRRVWMKLSKTKILEVPFDNKMPVTTMRKFLLPYRKLLKVGIDKSWKDVLTENFIKVVGDKLYFYTEEELYEL